MASHTEFEDDVVRERLRLYSRHPLPDKPTPAQRQAVLRNVLAEGESPEVAAAASGISLSYVHTLCKRWGIGLPKPIPARHKRRHPAVEEIALYTGISAGQAEKRYHDTITITQLPVQDRLKELKHLHVTLQNWSAANAVMATLDCVVCVYPDPHILHLVTGEETPIDHLDIYLLMVNPLRWRDEKFLKKRQ